MTERKLPNEPSRIWQQCIARRMGACKLNDAACYQCGPVEQTLRAAGWLECQWPRVQKTT